MKKFLFLVSLAASGASCFAESSIAGEKKGSASWYGRECHSTASGERYDPQAMTAAHRTLPFNTLVKVTNLRNNRSAVVRINDRGPFCKGRLIDVSKAAGEKLQMIHSGTARVSMQVIASR